MLDVQKGLDEATTPSTITTTTTTLDGRNFQHGLGVTTSLDPGILAVVPSPNKRYAWFMYLFHSLPAPLPFPVPIQTPLK